MKIRKGDLVQVMRGKDRGKEGEVLEVHPEEHAVVVKGVNIVKKSRKPNPQLGIAGGIEEFEAPIDVSNVMILDDKGNPTRIGFSIDEKTGTKVRIAKNTNKEIT